MHSKLLVSHLSRKALIYIRQSSLTQVQENRESQRRQYALEQRARELGFAEVEIIDQDLGRSASGTQARPGFERLVAAVLAGEVGAVFCLEASRLARNGRDWHHLLDLCALTGTLLCDPDGIYDPRQSNDRLLLGLKGSMSEFELTLLRQRAQEARLQKAQRGELRLLLPVGFEWTRDGRIVLDPDLRVQQTLHLIFRTYTERGSVRKVLTYFLENGLLVPSAQRGSYPGERILWKRATYGAMESVLTNPVYAGAYAFGKTENLTRVVEGRARSSAGLRKPRERWKVLLPEHHPGYISWPQYLRNQEVMKENAHRCRPQERKAGRGGGALLSGMVRCRRCGRRMLVLYRNAELPRSRWSYECTGEGASRTTRCLYLGDGVLLDALIRTELLHVLSPLAVEAAIQAAQVQHQQAADLVRAVELQWEQARYQASLEARRYQEVDPHNRLVALELERRWEAALAREAELERKLAEMRSEPSSVSAPSLEQLLALAQDLEAVWNAPQSDMQLKQRLVRLLIHEVLCDIDSQRMEAVLVLHWHGGRHSELRMPLRKRGDNGCRTPEEAAKLITEQAETLGAEAMTMLLNQRGLRTGRGRPFTSKNVVAFLRHRRLGKYARSSPVVAGVSLREAARRLQVSTLTLRAFIRRGLLSMSQRYGQGRCYIPDEQLHTPQVQAAVRAAQRHPNSLLSKAQKRAPSSNTHIDSGGA
jgi:DNA invertase Pin-like site-specific DNA recombinase